MEGLDGTALGVGENVVRAMKDLNIRIPKIDTYIGFSSFQSFRTSITSGGYVRSMEGKVGFGVGGGFGGGGAGGR